MTRTFAIATRTAPRGQIAKFVANAFSPPGTANPLLGDPAGER